MLVVSQEKKVLSPQWLQPEPLDFSVGSSQCLHILMLPLCVLMLLIVTLPLFFVLISAVSLHYFLPWHIFHNDVTKTTVSVVRVCPRAASYHSINTSNTTIITTSPQKAQVQLRQQLQQQQHQQPSGLARSKISVSPSPIRNSSSSSQRRSVNQALVRCCSWL